MRPKRLVVAALAAIVASAVGTSSASAFVPDFSDCPRSAPGAAICVDIQNTGGFMRINETNVNLGDSLRIRGAITVDPRVGLVFAPPAGTNGFFARALRVPGGLLGIDWPIPGNSIYVTAQLAGPASSIHLNPETFDLALPIKLKLDNPILGWNCYIGSNSNPIRLNLITGTTNPPAPNRPISGRFGDPAHGANYFAFTNGENVDNSFSVPKAAGCGLGAGLISGVVNLRLGLPAAGGNNTMVSVNNLGLFFL